MKRFAISALCALALLPLSSTLVTAAPVPGASLSMRQSSRIDWITDSEEIVDALHQAVSDDTPVMVYFHADWCPWCIKLEDETFSDSQVVRLARRFTCIKIDADSELGKKLMSEFQITGVPNIRFYNHGDKVNTVEGYEDADDFAADMRKALNSD